MTGRHTPSSAARRDRDCDRTAEPNPGRRRSVPPVLRVVVWLAALAAVAFTMVVAYGFIRLDHDVDRPQDGFSGWQCAGQSGTCDP
ncbi:hypothetical protein [Streptomyces sp. Ru72]|uniref:hypothetical protein n=1 Tax=Streptomyces sp. Ru72 TaxID=2080747 RepID=UPI000CDDEACE|nr:hypothetical protein [Streptomyces sp. Ru72]POX45956.1 hypothetical protein C3488_27955 [Streptomyces sp. Ru72]